MSMFENEFLLPYNPNYIDLCPRDQDIYMLVKIPKQCLTKVNNLINKQNYHKVNRGNWDHTEDRILIQLIKVS